MAKLLSDMPAADVVTNATIAFPTNHHPVSSTVKIFEFISGIMTLYPGDVIVTGTSSGCGAMGDGDQIRLTKARTSKLHNNVELSQM